MRGKEIMEAIPAVFPDGAEAAMKTPIFTPAVTFTEAPAFAAAPVFPTSPALPPCPLFTRAPLDLTPHGRDTQNGRAHLVNGQSLVDQNGRAHLVNGHVDQNGRAHLVNGHVDQNGRAGSVSEYGVSHGGAGSFSGCGEPTARAASFSGYGEPDGGRRSDRSTPLYGYAPTPTDVVCGLATVATVATVPFVSTASQPMTASPERPPPPTERPPLAAQGVAECLLQCNFYPSAERKNRCWRCRKTIVKKGHLNGFEIHYARGVMRRLVQLCLQRNGRVGVGLDHIDRICRCLCRLPTFFYGFARSARRVVSCVGQLWIEADRRRARARATHC